MEGAWQPPWEDAGDECQKIFILPRAGPQQSQAPCLRAAVHLNGDKWGCPTPTPFCLLTCTGLGLRKAAGATQSPTLALGLEGKKKKSSKHTLQFA